VLAIAAVGLAACGSDAPVASSSGSSSSSGTTPTSWSTYSDPAATARTIHVSPGSALDLPPRSEQALRALYTEPVAAMGLRLTRASVIQLDTGPHLQLYVEPVGAATNEDYISRIVPTAKVVAPDAFTTWTDLATFDMCQEPPPGVDDSAEPVSVTVLFMTRAQVESVDWGTATTTDLRRVIATTEGGELQVNAAIATDPAWTATNP
jgi:hypothetical protein